MFSLQIVEIINNGSAVAFNGLGFTPSSVKVSHRVKSLIGVHTIGQAYSAPYVVWTTLAKFGLHVGNMKFKAQ
jgi:hypothetical protein